jgi:predicted nucleic acid-binding Zn ribbon protein
MSVERRGVIVTEFQEQQIRLMREQGIGYKRIGARIGLSRDIVRNYCRSRELGGYGKALSRNLEEQVMLGKKCLCCGKDIEQPDTGRPRKFCSEKCRRVWWKIHPERMQKRESAMYPVTCARCGKEFLSYGNKGRKYCGHECYIKARFWEGEDENSEIGDAANQ